MKGKINIYKQIFGSKLDFSIRNGCQENRFFIGAAPYYWNFFENWGSPIQLLNMISQLIERSQYPLKFKWYLFNLN